MLIFFIHLIMINIIIGYLLRLYNSEYIYAILFIGKVNLKIDFFQKLLKKLLMLYFSPKKISLS